MKISCVEIQNYRKLKSCRIDFSEKTTLLVGANNSGKTSAMFALKSFLKDRKIKLDDFTISNLPEINAIGNRYISKKEEEPVLYQEWYSILPSLDVWLDVSQNELRYVAQVIPTLNWAGRLIGIRLIFEPKDVEKLCATYRKEFTTAREKQKSVDLKLWPSNMCDFLREEMRTNFEMHSYILDSSKLIKPDETDRAQVQPLLLNAIPLDFDPFKKLIRVDFEPAQKGFTDTSEDGSSENKIPSNMLSDQLRRYYDRQLDPEHQPTDADIKTLKELQKAQSVFNDQIKGKFQKAMKELSKFGYPGNYNPNIIIESKAQTSEIISHNTVVRYPLFEAGDEQLKLPEQYNGLGYQNLISMSFKLMSFRDSWVNGEKNQQSPVATEREQIPPIHLVLLEEPEVHLHVQVQQVFIKNAYKLLRNHKLLKGNSPFTTQLLISTHSSYVAMEPEFEDLRYFKRVLENNLPVSVVANLRDIFGINDKTARFTKRYLKSTHCDLFFADAIIMVEGAGERILLPHFIKKSSTQLDEAYISILEINGRHAHTLRPLIERLGVACLVITDLDIVNKTNTKSESYKIGTEQITTNCTISQWVTNESSVEKLLVMSYAEKQIDIPHSADGFVRVAYQTPVKVKFTDGAEHEFIPSTFEDSLAYENFKYFKKAPGLGGIKKIRKAFTDENPEAIKKAVYETIYGKYGKKSTFDKAEFALDLLMNKEPQSLKVPEYIAESLSGLSEYLTARNKRDFLDMEDD